MRDLATLSARERQQMIDDFVARVFGDVPDDAPGAGIAQGMRTLPAELPDEPTEEADIEGLDVLVRTGEDSVELIAPQLNGFVIDVRRSGCGPLRVRWRR